MRNLINIFKGAVLEEKLLWLYVALMPLMRNTFLAFTARRIILADFLFIGLFSVFFWKVFTGKRKIERVPLFIPLFLMFFSFLFSLLNSVSFADSFFEFAGKLRMF